MVGKWGVGSASRKGNIPVARGFTSSLHYFESAQDHFTQIASSFSIPPALHKNESTSCAGRTYRDLWRDDGPAEDLVGQYSGHLWTAEASRLITYHGSHQRQNTAAAPFFMYLAY